MAAADRKSLLALFGTRFDTYSAKVVLDEALEKAHLLGKDPLTTADLALLAPLLPTLRTRMQYIAAEVERLAGGARPAAPAPEAAPPAPAPAAPAPATPKAAAPAAAALPEVVAGAAKEARVSGPGPFRITSTEPGTVRWGANGWKTPPAASLPAGTTKVAGEPAVDTALAAAGAGFALVLGPFDGTVDQIDFTVRFAGDRWAPPCAVKLGA